jgi:S1-C subfamily serine protease
VGENEHDGAVSEPQPEAPRDTAADALAPQAIEPAEAEEQPYEFEDYGEVPVEGDEPTAAVPNVPVAGAEPGEASQTAILWGSRGEQAGGPDESGAASEAGAGAPGAVPAGMGMVGPGGDPQQGVYPGGYPMPPGAYPGVYPGYQGAYYGQVPGQPGGPVYGPPGVGPAFGQPAPQPGGRKRSIPATVAVVAIVIAAAIGAGIGHLAWKSPSSTNTAGSGDPGASPGYGNGNGSSGDPFGGFPGQGQGGGSPSPQPTGTANSSAVASDVDPGLVDVNSTFAYQSTGGSGTGMVLTSTGEVLTNNHVIDEATSISVTDIGNGKTYSATVIGYDTSQDIAVLQLQNASGLKTVNLGNSDQAAVGQSVVAIGNAGGVGGTPSPAAGEITGLNQSITAADDLTGGQEQLTGMIETDAQIESGDSGGPVATTSGQVIGMDTAASVDSGSGAGSGESNVNTGDGYAIPINEATSVAKQIESGKSTSLVHAGPTAFLGVDVSGTGDTAQITSVIPGTAAATLGLVAGDVITSFDNQTINSASQLTDLVLTLKPGDSVSIGWTDTQNQEHTGSVTMGTGPAQ